MEVIDDGAIAQFHLELFFKGLRGFARFEGVRLLPGNSTKTTTLRRVSFLRILPATSSLPSPRSKVTTAMFWLSTKASTARLNSCVICPSSAGETITFLRAPESTHQATRSLQLGDITVEVDAIQTMKRQLHMVVQ